MTAGPEKTGQSVPPHEQRESVHDEIQKAFQQLLSNGGIITHSGVILSYRYVDLQQQEPVLTPKQYSDLLKERTVKLDAHEARALLPEDKNLKQSACHIILPNTNEQLGYERGTNGGIHLFIRGTDEKGDPHDYPIGSYWQLGRAFAKYAEKILIERGFFDQVKSIQRYSDIILKDIAEKEGVGLTPQRHTLPNIKPHFRDPAA